MSYQPKLNVDAVLFSLNDVLIDVQYSYHQVVCKAVQLYLERALGALPIREPLITVEEVVTLQRIGGFANYWDLTRAFIAYFMTELPEVPIVTFRLDSMCRRCWPICKRLRPESMLI
jgi:hypothetical protein